MDWRCLKNNETLMSREYPWASTAAGPILLMEAPPINAWALGIRQVERLPLLSAKIHQTKTSIANQDLTFLNLALLNQCKDPSDAVGLKRTSEQDIVPIQITVTNHLSVWLPTSRRDKYYLQVMDLEQVSAHRRTKEREFTNFTLPYSNSRMDTLS